MKNFIYKITKRFKEKNFTFNVKVKSVARILYFKSMFNKISKIEEEIVECGIGKSRTFQILAILLQLSGRDSKLYGFDSFEGFPEPTKEDASVRKPKAGEWKKINEKQVIKTLKSVDIQDQFINSHIKLVKGFFNDTLPKQNIKEIALLHLDVDLYGSYKTCLEQLYPKVKQGGVVMFDEYNNDIEKEQFPGAKKAIDEYLGYRKNLIKKDDITGKYYLVKE